MKDWNFTIKDLKEMIKDVPDHTPVCVSTDRGVCLFPAMGMEGFMLRNDKSWHYFEHSGDAEKWGFDSFFIENNQIKCFVIGV